KTPPLIDGMHLAADEFLRRYDAMPDLKKAELINGEVFVMTSPVSVEKHGRPDSLVHFWLNYYAMRTPGVEPASNSTICLGPVDTPQPDAALMLLPEFGGRASANERDLIEGVPELIVEISASSAAVDLDEKLDMYRRWGAPEYLVWQTIPNNVEWRIWDNAQY